MRVPRLPRQGVSAPSFETFQCRLDRALSNWPGWGCSSSWQRGWTRWPFRVSPSQTVPSHLSFVTLIYHIPLVSSAALLFWFSHAQFILFLLFVCPSFPALETPSHRAQCLLWSGGRCCCPWQVVETGFEVPPSPKQSVIPDPALTCPTESFQWLLE